MENNNYPGSYYQPLFDLLNQEHGITPLESEMTDIIEVVEKMRGKQPAQRWVNGEYERLFNQLKADPSRRVVCYVDYEFKYGDNKTHICRDICTIIGERMEFVARGRGYGSIEFWPGVEEENFISLCNDLKVEWLDEQPATEPLTENARYELRLALRDMIKLVKRIYGDSAIPAEHQKRLDAADGLLQKHSKITDVLRTPAAGREGDAVAFAEWAATIAFFDDGTRLWELIGEGEAINGQFRFTTKEFYELFKQQNNP